MKEMMMKTMLLGMKYLKVASIVLLLTFTTTHFSWAAEDDILDLLPGILAASKLNIDNDGDGYTENQGDCSDLDAETYPGATEICGDGIDQDCNGTDLLCLDDIDNDGDGYTENQGDCNDTNPAISPGSTEICGDGIDQDCTGNDLVCTPTGTCNGEVISPLNLTIGTPLNQTIEAFGTKYYVFDVVTSATYTISLYNMATDNDWVLIEYISNCEDDYPLYPPIIAESSNLSTTPDIKAVFLDPAKYLLIVDEWDDLPSSYTLSVTR